VSRQLPPCPSTGKASYPRRKHALTVLGFMRAKGGFKTGGKHGAEAAFGVYRCPDCKRWHLTSNARGTIE